MENKEPENLNIEAAIRQLLIKALKKHNGDYIKSAADLKISSRTINKMVKNYNLGGLVYELRISKRA